jgi:hypothetical protein
MEAYLGRMQATLRKMEADQEELEASHEKIEAVVEPCNWAPHVKAPHLLTVLQGQVSEVLHSL